MESNNQDLTWTIGYTELSFYGVSGLFKKPEDQLGKWKDMSSFLGQVTTHTYQTASSPGRSNWRQLINSSAPLTTTSKQTKFSTDSDLIGLINFQPPQRPTARGDSLRPLGLWVAFAAARYTDTPSTCMANEQRGAAVVVVVELNWGNFREKKNRNLEGNLSSNWCHLFSSLFLLFSTDKGRYDSAKCWISLLVWFFPLSSSSFFLNFSSKSSNSDGFSRQSMAWCEPRWLSRWSDAVAWGPISLVYICWLSALHLSWRYHLWHLCKMIKLILRLPEL